MSPLPWHAGAATPPAGAANRPAAHHRARRVGAVVLVLASLLTGACTVSPTAPDVTRQTVDRFRQDHQVRYDLTQPRTAQELGVGPDEDSAIFDRDDSQFWDVAFTLPEGRTFTTDRAIAVGVFVPDPPGRLLESVTVNADARDLDDLAAQFALAAQQLDLDQTQIDQFIARERRLPPTLTSPAHNRVFSSPQFGHLKATAEARITEGADGIAINYSFTWQPGPALPGASPGASARPATAYNPEASLADPS